jgi:hypothetical protein
MGCKPGFIRSGSAFVKEKKCDVHQNVTTAGGPAMAQDAVNEVSGVNEVPAVGERKDHIDLTDRIDGRRQ